MRSNSAKQSNVRFTEPSVEFSIGTIPKSEPPDETDSNIFFIFSSGSFVTDFPNCPSSADSENVPSGPKKETVNVDSVDLQLEIISLKIFII